MRFFDLNDKKLFLGEIGELNKISLVNEGYEPTEEMKSAFLKKRDPIQNRLKDNKKKTDTKQSWKKNRRKIMKGIHDYHKSSEGKRFHRKLGRFLSSRDSLKGDRRISKNESIELSTLLSAFQTRIFISASYYRQILEAVEFDIFKDEATHQISVMLETLRRQEDLSENNKNFLLSIIDPKALSYSISEEFETDGQFVTEKLNELDGEINYDKLKDVIKQIPCSR